MRKYLIIVATALVALSCQSESTSKKGEPLVVCTTGMIGDAVKKLLPDSLATVEVLMGPGVDPHLYKATQGDIEDLSNARVIVYNGLHLEGKMGEIFEKLEQRKTVLAMGEFLQADQLINSTDYAGAHDPHIWFDVELWSKAVTGLAEALQKEFPEQRELIARRHEDYNAQLKELHQWVSEEVSSIPDSQKVMITAHDAFKYFGEAYGIEVRGLQGISTAAEYGLKDISNLVNYITERKIKAIFVESSVPKRSIEAVIEGARERGHNLKLGGELFSDAMGAANTPEGNYPGMVRHNVAVITEALK